MRTSFLLGALALASVFLGAGCSKDGNPGGGASGGTSSGGAHSGGSSGKASGGTSGSGGTSATSSDGAKSGGAGGAGGALASGGRGGSTTSSGGAKASGGSTGSGGKTASGGITSAGGATSAGGVTSAGGAISSTGGVKSSGGTSGGGAAGQVTSVDCTSPLKGDVTLSVPSGTFKDSVSVTLSTSISGAEIRYTTNGQAPSSASSLYSTALSFTSTTRLRAQAFVQGSASGAASGAIYVARAIDASHDLPVIILDSYGSGKLPTDDAKRVFVDVAYLALEPDSSGTVSLSSTPTTASFAAFHVRGNSSAMFDKVPYRLELRDETGADRDCTVLGMPADSDWALVGPHPDKTLIHNNFVYDLGRDMGMQVPRIKLAEVYVNLDTKPLAADDYQGVYQIVETIKDNKARLNLKQLDETKTSDAQITGGYIFAFEWANTIDNPVACPSGTTKPWNYINLVDPVPIVSVQQNYLTQYLVSFNSAVHGTNISDATNGYPKYIEPKTWVDQIIVQEFMRNLDAFVRSQYFYKDRDAKINAGPLWDYDATAGVGVASTGSYANIPTDGWQYEANATRMGGGTGTGGGFGTSSGTADWFTVLIADPTFKAQLVARWKELRGGILADSAVAARIDSVSQGLSNAADRNFKRWNILSQASVTPFTTPTDATWTGQISSMKTWLQKRAAWIDSQWK